MCFFKFMKDPIVKVQDYQDSRGLKDTNRLTNNVKRTRAPI